MKAMGLFYAMMHETIEQVEAGKMNASAAFRYIRDQIDDFFRDVLIDSKKASETAYHLTLNSLNDLVTGSMSTAGHIENHLRKCRFTRNELMVMVAILASLQYGKQAVERINFIKDSLR